MTHSYKNWSKSVYGKLIGVEIVEFWLFVEAYLKSNSLFGETVGKGDTIYRELVNFIDVSFYYAFNCSEDGIIEFDYMVSSIVEESSETVGAKP